MAERQVMKPPPDTDWIAAASAGEGWVSRAERQQHVCAQPDVSTGRYGDLWRCRCGQLWRVGRACAICDEYGESGPHGGQHMAGAAWRPATWWQRVRNRRRRHG